MVSVARFIGKGLKASALEFESGDLGNDLFSVTLLGDKGALGVGEGEDGGAEFENLESGELGNVSGARDGNKCRGLVEAVLRASFGDHLQEA